jgi:branched-subunit amino acid transport protein AzlD
MSEYEVDVYYTEKGRQFIRTHATRMPWLLLGKLVRAYVPIPWKPIPSSLIMAAIRAMLDLLFVFGLVRLWRGLPAAFRTIFLAMALTNALMVLSFYGYSRFAFAIEPFGMPLAAAAAVHAARTWRQRVAARPA